VLQYVSLTTATNVSEHQIKDWAKRQRGQNFPIDRLLWHHNQLKTAKNRFWEQGFFQENIKMATCLTYQTVAGLNYFSYSAWVVVAAATSFGHKRQFEEQKEWWCLFTFEKSWSHDRRLSLACDHGSRAVGAELKLQVSGSRHLNFCSGSRTIWCIEN